MKGYAVSSSENTSRGGLLYLLFCVAVLTGLGSIAAVLYWKFNYDGGVAWREDPGKQFAWHPILLTLAIVLSGLAGTFYRVFNVKKAATKSLHVTFMILSLASAAIGLWAVIDSHNYAVPPIPNFFSLHSWIGLIVLGVMGLQFLVGASVFSCFPTSKRAAFLPVHKYFGAATLAGATAAAVIGLTEEALFTLDNYTDMPEKGLVINSVGILLTVFTATVTFITTFRGFRIFN